MHTRYRWEVTRVEMDSELDAAMQRPTVEGLEMISPRLSFATRGTTAHSDGVH